MAAGKSGDTDEHAQAEQGAATEPGRGGREENEQLGGRGRGPAGRYGARPWRPGRVPRTRRRRPLPQVAATEPGRGGREEARRRWTPTPTTRCRYGARPWRPGRAGHPWMARVRGRPLRSPAVAAGKRSTKARALSPAASPLRSPAVAAGKSRCRRRVADVRRSCRYGARPWRPGRAPDPALVIGCRGEAATEPGRGGREERDKGGTRKAGMAAATEPGRGGREESPRRPTPSRS